MKLLHRGGRAGKDDVLTSALGDQELPSFSGVVVEALDRLHGHADLDEVTDLVSSDPGLSVRLLRVVNSPAYAPRMPIASVHRAAIMLGRNQLESLLIGTAVSSALPKVDRPGFESTRFWQAAATRAAAAATLASTVDPARRSEHFTAALLQDMAQPILVHAHSNYGDLLGRWEDRHHRLVSAEIAEMGWTHVDVGAAMCRHWDFPAALTEAITVHHDDPHHEHRITQWASLIEPDQDADEAVERAGEWFGLNGDAADAVLGQAREQASEIAALFT